MDKRYYVVDGTNSDGPFTLSEAEDTARQWASETASEDVGDIFITEIKFQTIFSNVSFKEV